jgi:CheY-like chemotaxis protein
METTAHNEKILVADDQVINITVTKHIMTQVGVIDFCDFAMNGQDAIEKIKREVQN